MEGDGIDFGDSPTAGIGDESLLNTADPLEEIDAGKFDLQ